MSSLRALAAALCAALALTACEAPLPPATNFKGTDLRGETFAADFRLTDHYGVTRELADFRGKVVMIFFGYTHCPDVCPTTLSDAAQAMSQLTPAEAERVQVLFVSVDPARDSLDMLREYVPYFHPDFIGLTGSPEAVAEAAAAFRIAYRHHAEADSASYLIDHTAGSYLLDRRGRVRVFLPFAQMPDDIAHDLRLLLAEG